MSRAKPEFHLQRVLTDGSASEPEIYPLLHLPDATQMSRRGFVGTGLTLASLFALPGAVTAQMEARNRSVTIVLAHTDAVRSLAITPNGKFLASASADRTVKLWSFPDGQPKLTLTDHAAAVLALAVNPDGTLLASGSEDRSIKVWSLPDGGLVKSWEADRDGFGVNALAFSPAGKMLASGSATRTAKLWSAPDGAGLGTLTGHTNWVKGVAFSGDSNVLLTASGDKTVGMWSTATTRLLRSLKDHTGSVNAVTVAPDGKVFATASSDKAVRLWSLPDGMPFRTLSEHHEGVNAVAFSPDGKILATGSADRTVRLWSLPDGQPLRTLVGHWDSVQAVAISPNGKLVVSGDNRGVILIWNLASGERVAHLFDPKIVNTDIVVQNNPEPMERPVNPAPAPVRGEVPAPVPPPLRPRFRNPPDVPFMPPPYMPYPAWSGPRMPFGGGGGGGGGGTYCSCNKVCTCIPVYRSDREAKANFTEVDGRAVLERLVNLPIQSWNYHDEDVAVRHIGPMAQDFAAAFQVGRDDRSIAAVDANGVALAAIQGLHDLLRAKDEMIQIQQEQIGLLRQELDGVRQQLAALTARVEEAAM